MGLLLAAFIAASSNHCVLLVGTNAGVAGKKIAPTMAGLSVTPKNEVSCPARQDCVVYILGLDGQKYKSHVKPTLLVKYRYVICIFTCLPGVEV